MMTAGSVRECNRAPIRPPESASKQPTPKYNSTCSDSLFSGPFHCSTFPIRCVRAFLSRWAAD